MRQLPLGGRVVFVDWHGVLSRDPFWTSIRQSTTHPLRGQLEAGLADIFAKESATANEWMKGLLSSDQVIAAMDIQLDRRFRDDFFARRLDVDCARMKVNVELFEVLRKIKAIASVVLATDNMDCFARTFGQVRARTRRPRSESETLADWAIICDDIICSSDVGALKAEDPIGFFDSWLAANGLQFSDAALIDDRADNCAAFASQGGTPIQYKMTTNDVTGVVESLNEWFASAP
jgi:FMN phosphatase YigB (HAD superfamily)